MTRDEILSIQRQLGLTPDGIYGPKTSEGARLQVVAPARLFTADKLACY